MTGDRAPRTGPSASRILHRWTVELLGAPPPTEVFADCADCTMCRAPEGDPPAADTVVFDPRTKCCTYVPRLANFLAGSLLRSDDPELEHGRATLRARLAGRTADLLGVGQPLEFRAVAAQEPGRFGRDVTLRCPHFVGEGGRCGIWGHTEAMCYAWFCKHVRGSRGRQSWRALLEFLRGAEDDVARWCVLRLVPDEIDVDRVLADPDRWRDFETGAGADSSPRRRGPEELERFYVACAGLADGLSLADVLTIAGPETSLRAAIARRMSRDLATPGIPARLRVGPFQVVGQSRTRVRIVTDSRLDPLDVPGGLLTVLPAFDGRPTDEVLEDIRVRAGTEIPPEIVRSLVDFRVLLPA